MLWVARSGQDRKVRPALTKGRYRRYRSFRIADRDHGRLRPFDAGGIENTFRPGMAPARAEQHGAKTEDKPGHRHLHLHQPGPSISFALRQSMLRRGFLRSAARFQSSQEMRLS